MSSRQRLAPALPPPRRALHTPSLPPPRRRCHPGAWLQVACQALGPAKRGGLVLGVDLQETRRPERFCDERVKVFHADARALDAEFWAQFAPEGFDAVLSDM